MQYYEWSEKTPLQKKLMVGFSIICAIFLGYIVLAFSTGHLMTWADLNWRVVWGILKCIFIIALFPAILLPVLFAARADRPYEFQHAFYQEWARLLTGRGKGGGTVCFFVEDVESARLQRSFFKDKPIFLLTINFKSWLFRRSPTRVAIRADKEDELRPLEDWMRKNQIMTTWDLPLENQRRS